MMSGKFVWECANSEIDLFWIIAPNNGKQNPCGTSCHSPVRPKGYNPAPSKDVFNNCQKAGILSMMMGWMAGPWFEGSIGVAVWGGTNTVGTAATMGCINN
jgi:hypothetical protein